MRKALEAVTSRPSPQRRGREVLVREELLVLAARIEQKRSRLRERPGIRLVVDDEMRRAARAALPFRLTNAQKRAVREIADDLASGRAMARLLQGDVGSGKTAVAALALLLAARNRTQGALMAPTEVLAEQHAETLAKLLGGAGVRLALLTGRLRGPARRTLLAALEAGAIDVLVGTHALVETPVRFRRLSLVVVDEQHRFGVAHRARLFRKGETPHVLVMTATPIPRSLAWAIYGELDVSVLDEKPPGRTRVVTRVREETDRERIYRFAGERVAAGERVYVVVPAIDEGDRDVAATSETHTGRRLDQRQRSGPPLPLPVRARDTVLRDFARRSASSFRRRVTRSRRGRRATFRYRESRSFGLAHSPAPRAGGRRAPFLVRPRRGSRATGTREAGWRSGKETDVSPSPSGTARPRAGIFSGRGSPAPALRSPIRCATRSLGDAVGPREARRRACRSSATCSGILRARLTPDTWHLLMKILVTGGTGFVGTHLVNALVRRGHEVAVLARHPDRARNRYNRPVERVRGDVLDGPSLVSALQGRDAVIHLVGIIHEQGAQTFDRMHRLAPENVAAAARDAGVRRFLHMSAMGARRRTVGVLAQQGRGSARSSQGRLYVTAPHRGRPGDGFVYFSRRSSGPPALMPVHGSGEPRFSQICLRRRRVFGARKPNRRKDVQVGGPAF